jgi:hypothetical protein
LRSLLSTKLPHVGRLPEGDDYLLFPIRQVPTGRGLEGQFLLTRRAFPKTKPSRGGIARRRPRGS